MPLYEYECLACHRHTEKIQKFSDPEITQCPHCGETLQRVITAPAIAFKGGGWYADGYGNAKPKPSGDAAPTKGDGSSGKSEGSDSAPAAPSDAGNKPSSNPDAPSKPAPAATPAPAPSTTPTKS